MNDNVNDHGEILARLEKIARAGKSVRFLNVYKGIPIAYEATILDIRPYLVRFRVHRYQAACLQLQRRTFLQSIDLGGMVRAAVHSVDSTGETAGLTGFKYADKAIGQRMEVRVSPKEETPVELVIKTRRLGGQLCDLSNGGVGVVASSIYLLGLDIFSPGSPVSLSFKLPLASQVLSVSGTIANAFKELATYRLGIRISPEGNTKAAIQAFIAQRQVEIMRELRTTAGFSSFEG